MANLNVSYSEMTDAAAQLQTGKEDLITRLTTLQTLINGLVDSGFVTDSASGAFQSAYEGFTNGVTQAVTNIDQMSGFLTSAAEVLSDTDSQLAKALNG